ncbi:MAG: hypothetical protein M1834_005302 [Cirrosporium novae-zelandiae]|nr:MAG: hypothetical protein M1834_005302 [Cirrosporium novae-zelandiae]
MVAPTLNPARSSGAAGILSIPASTTQKSTPSAPSHRSSANRAPAPRLKVVIRRLPPGLTAKEFETTLGEDWKLGGGKVDWFLYKEGKVSKDLQKPSKPARAYFHVTEQDHVATLADAVKKTNFTDAKNTTRDAALLGPPSVEFSPYNRIPSSKVRKDARMGTIDQDSEFIDFLESLTNPVTKPPTIDADPEANAAKTEKVTTTPLIQYLKDKKANKAKEAASAKASKHSRQESKEAKIDATSIKKLLKPEKNTTQTEKSPRKDSKVEKATKDVVKVLNKQATTARGQAAPPSPSPSGKSKDAAPASPVIERRRERGSAAAAARILQRDLGLIPNGPRGKAARLAATNAEKVSAEPKTPTTPSTSTAQDIPQIERKGGRALQSPRPRNRNAGNKNKDTQPPQNAPTAPADPTNEKSQATTKAPTGPAANRGSSKQTTLSSPKTTSSKGQAASSSKSVNVTPTATQAFLKHANPSQGVTEPLLEEAFKPFGTINKVEIDKKKGFAYIDFAEPEGLQKAIQASPVKVAQGQVVVLERKTGPALANRNNPSGSGRGRGGIAPIVRGRGGRGRSNRGGGRSGTPTQGVRSGNTEATGAGDATASTPVSATAASTEKS